MNNIESLLSGVGMVPNVTGRFPNELVKGELRTNRIVVLRLTKKTDGNAAGLGMADVTTSRVNEYIWVSDALLKDVQAIEELEVAGDPLLFQFDSTGMLMDLDS
ncbi:hypothetical protein [Alicyclobacillus ferrooxydans]|uniref:Uncharacterized protein n=1 Tax=Alicyclobacillus ferrooxydans TaxID=471514 RepID=A0A0P9CD73_9BACL|nr:hypothetical protein [Alicyclobacillus ferrooxydans]KPV40804.1 hypothetical protein AN477_21055 [Alicyclobacillus ferrooxydans]